MRLSTFVVSAFMLILPLTGCLAPEDNRIVVEEPTIFDFLNPIPETTWFHYSGAVNALDSDSIKSANLTVDLSGDNVPFWTQGSYYGIGMTTFEPTMGITSSDNLYMSSYGNGPAGSTAIVQCTGLIGMTDLSDYCLLYTSPRPRD